MKILVSRCLLGDKCRYKGDGCYSEKVAELAKRHELIGVCPEELGGLPTPREAGERVGDKVLTKSGADITRNFALGAQKTLCIAKESGAELCILKSKSPSCGSGKIYDGTFSATLVGGDGVTTELLKRNGFKVIDEFNIGGI